MISQFYKRILDDNLKFVFQGGSTYRGEEWKCIFGEFRMPFLNGHYFMVASRFDSYQLAYNIFGSWPPADVTTDKEIAYAEAYGKRVEEVIRYELYYFFLA